MKLIKQMLLPIGRGDCRAKIGQRTKNVEAELKRTKNVKLAGHPTS